MVLTLQQTDEARALLATLKQDVGDGMFKIADGDVNKDLTTNAD